MANLLGVPVAHRDSFRAPPVEIWACHWKTLRLFVALGTQWRTGMSGPTGLDYAALPVAARGTGIKLTPSRFEDLRVLESEVLKIVAERSKNG